jgi:hypothetical protein
LRCQSEADAEAVTCKANLLVWKLKRMLKLLQVKPAADLKQKTDTESCWGKSQAAADAKRNRSENCCKEID